MYTDRQVDTQDTQLGREVELVNGHARVVTDQVVHSHLHSQRDRLTHR